MREIVFELIPQVAEGAVRALQPMGSCGSGQKEALSYVNLKNI